MKPDELKSELKQIRSLRAERDLLAELVRAGHATRPFAAGHRHYLEQTAEEHVKKLKQAGLDSLAAVLQ